MKPEFDQYAEHYSEALRNPLRDGFGGGGAFYFERKYILLKAFFEQHGLDPKRMSWMDLGCGRGDLLRLGQSEFGAVTGCDISGEMVSYCQDLKARQQPAPGVIPFDDASFDLVTAVCVYHHVDLPDRAGLTAEVVRVLKPGGWMCIIEHNPWNPGTQYIVRTLPMDADAKLLRMRASQRLLREAGLSAIEGRFFLWFPEGLYRKLGGIETYLERVPMGGQYAIFGRK